MLFRTVTSLLICLAATVEMYHATFIGQGIAAVIFLLGFVQLVPLIAQSWGMGGKRR